MTVSKFLRSRGIVRVPFFLLFGFNKKGAEQKLIRLVYQGRLWPVGVSYSSFGFEFQAVFGTCFSMRRLNPSTLGRVTKPLRVSLPICNDSSGSYGTLQDIAAQP